MIDPSLIPAGANKNTAEKTEQKISAKNSNNNNTRINIEDLLFGISFDDPNAAVDQDIKIEQPVDSNKNQVQENIVEVIGKNENLQTLLKTIVDLNLSDTLQSLDQITLFAPSDEAFAQIGDKKLEANDIQRHVIKVTIPAESIATGPVFTLSKEIIMLEKSPVGESTLNQLQYNGKSINIVETDIQASNGVIHIIDSLIMWNQFL